MVILGVSTDESKHFYSAYLAEVSMLVITIDIDNNCDVRARFVPIKTSSLYMRNQRPD
jgi:hypothetical protein